MARRKKKMSKRIADALKSAKSEVEPEAASAPEVEPEAAPAPEVEPEDKKVAAKAKAAKAKAAKAKAAKAKVRVRLLTPMAGVNFSAAPGDIVTFPKDEAKGIIDSGAGEAVDTDEAKLRQMAKDAGFELVEAQ